MEPIKVTGSKRLEDGLHNGVIVRIDERKEPYEYVDLIIQAGEAEVKAGYPATINPVSNLGKLLERFGCPLKIGSDVDVEKTLLNQKCQFMSMSEERDGNTFSKVIANSVKPIK